jgi:hypothetical protein
MFYVACLLSRSASATLDGAQAVCQVVVILGVIFVHAANLHVFHHVWACKRESGVPHTSPQMHVHDATIERYSTGQLGRVESH